MTQAIAFDVKYAMWASHMRSHDDFVHTGTLTELVERIELDASTDECPNDTELMVSVPANADEARELGVEPGTDIWVLFDRSFCLEKPEVTVDLIERYAEHVYDGQMYMEAV